jgi:hypothetical protein
MLHGPFPKFQALIADAVKRSPYVKDAFHTVLEEIVFEMIDDDIDVTDWTVLDAMAKQCGMVITAQPDGFGGHGWTYDLTEG